MESFRAQIMLSRENINFLAQRQRELQGIYDPKKVKNISQVVAICLDEYRELRSKNLDKQDEKIEYKQVRDEQIAAALKDYLENIKNAKIEGAGK